MQSTDARPRGRLPFRLATQESPCRADSETSWWQERLVVTVPPFAEIGSPWLQWPGGPSYAPGVSRFRETGSPPWKLLSRRNGAPDPQHRQRPSENLERRRSPVLAISGRFLRPSDLQGQ